MDTTDKSENCSCCGLKFCSKSPKVKPEMDKKDDQEGNVLVVPPVPVIVGIEEEDGGQKKDSVPSQNSKTFIAPPPPTLGSGSLLGADLLLKAMPPPSSGIVKKARNLVQPGMSMVKWMKLQENKPHPPTRRKIPLSEIQKHDKESDCWMVITNCVYDVTEYLPYHPGGIPELMKGAGKDATALFNEVHRWVNFDSILRSCLLGYMLVEPGESFDESEEVGVVENRLVPTKRVVPQTRFSQNESQLFFQVDTMVDDELSEDNWCVAVLNRERFLLKVILKPPDLWMLHLKLLQSIKDDSLVVNFQNSFRKATITFKKPSIGPWKSLGTPLEGNNQLMDSRSILVDDFCGGIVIEKENVTHDVILLGIKPVSTSLVHVPVGFHLKIRLPDKPELSRKYTPVIRSITGGGSENGTNDKNIIYFLIKIYPNGQLTKSIGLLRIESTIEMGVVAGIYNHSFLRNCDTLALIGGGTGLTPFIRILDFCKRRSLSYPISRIVLIFFNHTEDDIIWKDQLMEFAKGWSIFHFFPVVSSQSKDWSGLSGRVSDIPLFESVLNQTVVLEQSSSSKSGRSLREQLGRFKAMVCGSPGFNDACVTMLKKQSIVDLSASEDVFLF